eukprot:scaffold20437_cov41-Attheya_sp.AAC.2
MEQATTFLFNQRVTYTLPVPPPLLPSRRQSISQAQQCGTSKGTYSHRHAARTYMSRLQLYPAVPSLLIVVTCQLYQATMEALLYQCGGGSYLYELVPETPGVVGA